MAIFRKLHTSFWSDTFVQDLNNEQRLFYLYLLTNEKTKQCGIYEISKKQMCFDLGYSIDTVSKLLKYFIAKGKILYSEDTKEIAIKNWLKYNNSTSPKVVSCINSELCNVKYRVLIEYVNGIYTASQEEKEQEEEKEEEQEPEKERGIVIDGETIDLNEAFEQVWKAYNGASTRQVGSKSDAKKKFLNLPKKDIEALRVNLPIFIKSLVAGGKADFFPNLTTYLNQKRYFDEKPPVADKVAEFEKKHNDWFQ